MKQYYVYRTTALMYWAGATHVNVAKNRLFENSIVSRFLSVIIKYFRNHQTKPFYSTFKNLSNQESNFLALPSSARMYTYRIRILSMKNDGFVEFLSVTIRFSARIQSVWSQNGKVRMNKKIWYLMKNGRADIYMSILSVWFWCGVYRELLVLVRAWNAWNLTNAHTITIRCE